MTTPGWLVTLWLTRFSSPAGERVLYRHIGARRPLRILELGLGRLRRTERVLRHAVATAAGQPVAYVGVDRFESRQVEDGPGVSLKEAHRRLSSVARVQLVPGNVDTNLSRLCNHLGAFDLVLVSADNPARQLERAWFFVQRLTSPETVLFAESDGGGGRTTWAPLSRGQLADLAARSLQRRAG